MKLILVALFFLMSACSHHHNQVEHHHHAFEKNCAYEVANGHYDVKGEEKLSVAYEDETYYFSSEEKMRQFKQNIQENVKRARKSWRHRR